MSRFVDLGGGRVAHASGALWLEEEQAAVLADVHLGYGWALRRRGQLGPVGDDRTRRKLMETVEELRPRRVVLLGDVVHAPRPVKEERASLEEAVDWLRERTEVTVVLGNHDRAFRSDYPDLRVEVCDEWRSGELIAVHGDRALPQGGHILAGHVHPALAVQDHAGASHKMPVFVAGLAITLLPAFSPLSAGYDVRLGLPFEVGDPQIVVASGRRAVMLGPLSLLQSSRKSFSGTRK